MATHRKALSMTQFLAKKYVTYKFDGVWKQTLGNPERNFKCIVYGDSGNGKTDFCVKFAKYLCRFGRVDYNSFEEGDSETLQMAFKRNNMMDEKGNIMLLDRWTVDDLMKRLRARNSANVVVLDSRDYMNLTTSQYKSLTEAFPKKAFIIIAWKEGERPKGRYAQDIEYMCDIKIKVENFVAYPRCRYGGNEPFLIWDKGQTIHGQAKKKVERQRTNWDKLSELRYEGREYAPVLTRKNKEYKAVYYCIEEGLALIQSGGHFESELALSDLCIKASELR